mgnify:CR=1 FL=1
MSTVATQSLLGQSPDVVKGVLGDPRFHQPNSANQTDLYVYSPNYLRDIFPLLTTGIIGIYKNNQCIALKVVFSKTDYRYDSFIYNREMASRLFDRVVGGGYAYWQEIEAEPRDSGVVHYVYCMGHRVATTWDAAAMDNTLTSDVSIFLDNRCEPYDDSDLNQPITTPPPSASQDLPFLRPTNPTPSLPSQEQPTAEEIAFEDISGNRYEAEILKAANTYHIIAGYEDGTFKPTNPVTRDQGLTMLIKAMQEMVADDGAIVMPDELTEPPFADVPVDHKSAPQFYYAKENGILSGDDLNKAHPDSAMTRAELVAMLHGGLQVVVEQNYTQATTPGQVVEPVASPVSFSDLADHWGKGVIQEMANYGVASPLDETGTQFAPDTDAQRDFTAAALVRLMELKFRSNPGTETKPKPVTVFPDIADNIYKEDILKAANSYGIVSGYEDGKFHPQDELSREQAVVILVNVMQNLVKDADAIQIPETLSDPPPFPDVKAGGSATKIQFAKEAGLVSGDDQGNFRPLDKISRAEVMAMVHKGLEFVVEANYGPTISLTEAVKASENPTAEFSDIPTDHWAKETLVDLRSFGIATPLNEEGTAFKPDQHCLRDYATAAMVRMNEVEFQVVGMPTPPDGNVINFSDIQGNPYRQEILKAANVYHLVAGYEDGTFRPEAPTTREQAVAMLVDALEDKVNNKEAINVPDHLTQPPFNDVDINRWSATKIHFAKQAGIVSGDDLGRFNPEAQLSRAQLVAMADQTLRFAIWVDLRRNNMPLDQVMALEDIQTFSFDDIPSSHWGLAAITEMGKVGLALPLEADEPTQFAPNSTAFRDFTVATCVRLIEAPYEEDLATEPPGDMPFVDIGNSPYAQEITRAVSPYKIVSGADDGLFHPAESISREHVVAMLVKALQQMVSPEVIDIPDQVFVDPFEDVPANSLFAPQIKFISDSGIMSGDEGTNLFRPKNDLTRAELMAVANNALNFVIQYNFGNGATIPDVVEDLGDGVQFSDIGNHWGESTIELMSRLGIALPREAGRDKFEPNMPSRRDYATASMVHMLEVKFVDQ